MHRVNFNLDSASHDDHVSKAHLAVIHEILRDGQASVVVPPQAGIFIATVTLPGHLPSVPSALRGPLSGEAPVGEADAFYGIRGEKRPNLSRLTALPSAPTRLVTVIVGRLEQGADGVWSGVLFTAYGGPCAPQEPGDPYLVPERLAASQAFWREHALSVDAGIPVQRVKTVNRATFLDPEGSRSAVEGYAYTIFSLDD